MENYTYFQKSQKKEKLINAARDTLNTNKIFIKDLNMVFTICKDSRYHCDFCDKDFGDDTSILKHLKEEHPAEKIPMNFNLKIKPKKIIPSTNVEKMEVEQNNISTDLTDENSRFSCDFCPWMINEYNKFKDNGIILRHIRKEHPNEKIPTNSNLEKPKIISSNVEKMEVDEQNFLTDENVHEHSIEDKDDNFKEKMVSQKSKNIFTEINREIFPQFHEFFLWHYLEAE